MKKSIRVVTVTVVAGITLAASTGLAAAQPGRRSGARIERGASAEVAHHPSAGH